MYNIFANCDVMCFVFTNPFNTYNNTPWKWHYMVLGSVKIFHDKIVCEISFKLVLKIYCYMGHSTWISHVCR